MSAFIVSDATINQVISFINSDTRNPHIYRPLESIGLAWDSRDAREDIGNKMFDLNIRGVEARYGEGKAEECRPLNYKYVSEAFASRIQAYKSLQCWLYQCSEGHIPEESDLWKAFDAVESKMARHIVGRLSEYQNAVWDVSDVLPITD